MVRGDKIVVGCREWVLIYLYKEGVVEGPRMITAPPHPNTSKWYLPEEVAWDYRVWMCTDVDSPTSLVTVGRCWSTTSQQQWLGVSMWNLDDEVYQSSVKVPTGDSDLEGIVLKKSLLLVLLTKMKRKRNEEDGVDEDDEVLMQTILVSDVTTGNLMKSIILDWLIPVYTDFPFAAYGDLVLLPDENRGAFKLTSFEDIVEKQNVREMWSRRLQLGHDDNTDPDGPHPEYCIKMSKTKLMVVAHNVNNEDSVTVLDFSMVQ